MKYIASFGLFCAIGILLQRVDPVAVASDGWLAGINRHPLSVIEADVYVSQRLTRMRLRTFADDLELLHGLEPDDSGLFDPVELKAATRKHATYLSERITVRDEFGELVQPNIVEIVDIEIPDSGVLAGSLMDYQLGYVFEYRHDSPQYLVFEHDVIDDEFLFPAEVTLLLKQAGSDVSYRAMMKHKQPEVVNFDWDRPPLSTETSEKEWNEWFDEQREKMLGITSYSSVYAFLYITDFEVRNEVLVPLAMLATSIDFERADPAFLDIDEQEAARDQIKQFFSAGNEVSVNGMQVAPEFDRIDFYGLDLRDFAVRPAERKISMGSGRVGIIMSYRVKARPERVTLSWKKFTSSIRTVETVVFSPEKTERLQFSSYLADNSFEWVSPARPPVSEIESVAFEPVQLRPARTLQFSVVSLIFAFVAIILLGLVVARRANLGSLVLVMLLCLAGLPFTLVSISLEPAKVSEDQSLQIFSRLHRNLFRSFDYFDAEDSYDALALSVEGPLLRQLYLDFRKSLEVREQGNAVARIDEINLIEGHIVSPYLEPTNRIGFTYDCNWNLVGTIEHWGHIHTRTNEYRALFQVEEREGAWKITEMQVVDQRQGPVKTSLRRF
ncbi:MAG TPA: hypothetical protein PKD64_09120 [Pirellulaceae bacterium]|nr:hypothetical protein [Pirellulaceae bacterium]HMO92348.1 hypothetical protein [Pirellulaceae bacterium]HMP69272.1 hypothetical protein [Pirellulaceae bacterium]